MPTLQELIANPDFRALSGPDKIKIAGEVDPDFAKLPLKHRSMLMLEMLQPRATAKSEDPGFWKTIGSDIASIPGQMIHPLDTLRSAKSATDEQVGETAKAAREGRYSEMIGHGLGAALPVIGPAAVRAGEELGGGQTGAGIAHTTELLAPSGLKAAYRALPLPEGGSLPESAPLSARAKAMGKGAWEGVKSERSAQPKGILKPTATLKGAAKGVAKGWKAELPPSRGYQRVMEADAPQKAPKSPEPPHNPPRDSKVAGGVYERQGQAHGEARARDALVKDANVNRWLRKNGWTKSKFNGLDEAGKKALFRQISKSYGTDYRYTSNTAARLDQVLQGLPD